MAYYQMSMADGVSAMSGVARDDDAGAMREACAAACDVLRDELREGRCPTTITITVTAEGRRAVGTVRVTGSFE